MARIAGQKREVTEARLLAAGMELFAKSAFGAVRLRDIAGAVGCNPALIHHYFGDKRGLFDACVEALYAELREGALEIAAAALVAPESERWELAMRRGFRLACANRDALRMLMREISDRGGLDAERRERLQKPLFRRATGVVEALLGRSPGQATLDVQSAITLVVRYALAGDEELAMFTDNAPDPQAAVEEHLVSVAARLFG